MTTLVRLQIARLLCPIFLFPYMLLTETSGKLTLSKLTESKPGSPPKLVSSFQPNPLIHCASRTVKTQSGQVPKAIDNTKPSTTHHKETQIMECLPKRQTLRNL